MITINNVDELKRVVHDNDTCLIKLGAAWCGPCKVIEKNIEDIEKYHTDVCFIEVDIDKADEEIIDIFNVRNIPATIVVKNGVIMSKEVGLQTQPQLEDRLL